MLRSGGGPKGNTGDTGPTGAIGGTIANTQVAFGTAADTIGGDADMVWVSATKSLKITTRYNGVTGVTDSGSLRFSVFGAGQADTVFSPDLLGCGLNGPGTSGLAGVAFTIWCDNTDENNYAAFVLDPYNGNALLQGAGTALSNFFGMRFGISQDFDLSGNFVSINAGLANVELQTAADGGAFKPGADNSQDSGTASNKWRTGYFGTSVVTPMLEGAEIATPTAPADGSGRTYFKAAGAGKTGLYVLFPSGTEQQIAVEV
jgi:hypothetical protein